MTPLAVLILVQGGDAGSRKTEGEGASKFDEWKIGSIRFPITNV
jgi:hypothetical protein